MATLLRRCAGSASKRARVWLPPVTRPLNTTAVARRPGGETTAGPSDTDRSYCVDLVRRFDHSNYLCTLLLDENTRDAAFAVRAINVEMAQIRDATREQLAGQMRYQFWQDAIELIYAGRPSRHPVTAALADAVERHDLPQGFFVEMLNARVDDQKRAGFATMVELEHYCDQTASSVLLLLMQMTGTRSEAIDRAACHVGRAIGLSAVVRGAPMLLQHREVRFPKEIMDEHGLTPRMLENKPKTFPELEDVVFAIASAANTHIESARAIEGLPAAAKQVLLPAVPCALYLEKLQSVDFDIYDPALHRRDGMLPAKLWKHKHWDQGF